MSRRQPEHGEQMEEENGALRDATFQLHHPEQHRHVGAREEERRSQTGVSKFNLLNPPIPALDANGVEGWGLQRAPPTLRGS